MMKDEMIPQKHQPSSEFSSRDEARRNVGEVFKRVDILLKNGEIARAQEELKLANQLRKELYQKDPFAILGDKKCFLPDTPLPLKPLEAMINTIAPPNAAKTIPPQSTITTNKIQNEEGKKQRIESLVDRKHEFDCYRDALIEAWRDGALTQSEERQLHELRTLLEISDVEHRLMEGEIKYKCYKDAVSKQLTENPAVLYDSKLISDLQKAFQIAHQEQAQIQSQFIQAKRNQQRDKILLIDDEIPFLKVLSAAISEEGFDVLAVPTTDQALQMLQTQIPDLIICDINLKSSSLNGFNFYTKIQEFKHLQQVPFIFITGIVNEEILRTVKEIGADDCLTKPFSRHSMLSTIRGKLKRFKQLRGLSTNQSTALL